MSIFMLVAGLTVFVSSLYAYENSIYNFLSYILLLVFVMRHDVVNSPYYWLVYIILFLPIIFWGWQYIGNQKFVHFYLLIILSLCCFYKTYQNQIFKFSSFYFIFIIFGIASIWKLFIADFRSGNFLEFLFLSGTIFDFYAAIAESKTLNPAGWAQVYDNILNVNRDALFSIKNAPSETEIVLKHTSDIILFSKIGTIISLVTQVGITFSILMYCLTKKKFWVYVMHALIVEFIIIAYYPTKVIGFGILLCIIGIMNAHYYAPKYKSVYLGLIVLLMLYGLPIHNLLMEGKLNYLTAF